MATIDTSKEPYMDTFDSSKNYSKVLFQPNRPVFQSELNEVQSNQQYQQGLIGNSVFKEGSIIAGMNLVPQGTITPGGGGDQPGVKANTNIISVTSLTAVNSKIDASQFQSDGEVDIKSTSTQQKDYPGLQFTAVADSTNKNIALRFKVQRTRGSLYNLLFTYPAGLTQQSYKIDGQDIKSAANDPTATITVDTNGNTINLSDGNTHEILLVFSGVKAGSYPITVQANPTYSAIAEGSVDFKITELKAEMGQTSTTWTLAPGDDSVATGGQRVVLMRITDGLIWLGGMVRVFKQQDITITGKGNESIGVSLNEDIVTAEMDGNLYDHSTGAISQWSKGADRLHYTVALVYNDPNSTTIFTLKDGKLNNNNNKPDYAVFNDILAKRTNDESGSYRVSGFNMWSEKNNQDDSKVNVIVDSGLAYVLGYSVDKRVSTTIPVDKATQVSQSGNESFYYSVTNDDAGILDNQPVKVVDRVTANIQVSNEQVNRNAASADPDSLANTQIYKIDEVYTKDTKGAKTTYVQGTDYSLKGGNQIQWDITHSGHAPVTGTTYYVSYEYTAVLEANKDYEVTTAGDQDQQVTKVSFINMNGKKPMDNSLVQVDYEFFLAREDVITLNKDGNFTVIKGQPMPLSTVQPPKQIDPLTLIIGYVVVFPNSDRATTTLDTITRIPFSGLQQLQDRVSNLEYNVSVTNLNRDAMENQDPVTMRDVFSDNFTDVQKADLTNKDFTAAYDLASGVITLPPEASTGLQPGYNGAGSSIHKFGHMVTVPFVERAAVNQPIATSTININEYQVFNVLGTLSIDPASDSWVEQQDRRITVNGATQRFSLINTYEFYNRTVTINGQTRRLSDIVNLNGFNQNMYGGGRNFAGDVETQNGMKTLDTVLEYARPRTINFSASNLAALADSLKMTIDGKSVDIIPASGYSAGTDKGTIKADAQGTVKGSFNIPDSTVRTGVREVVLSNDHNQAITTYTANGIHRDLEGTITRTHITANIYDPLAESFKINTDSVITSVDAYFATKDDGKDTSHRSDVTMQIRSIGDQGFPTGAIYAEKTLSPDDINISDDGTVNTKFELVDPLFVKAGTSYALVFITDSDKYNMYVAKMGAHRLTGDKSILTGQAYIDGVLYTSSNAQSWTISQDTDLTFQINTAIFNDSGTILFDPITFGQDNFTDKDGKPIKGSDGNPIKLTADQVVLLASYLTPDNTGLAWQMRYTTKDQPSTISINDIAWIPLPNEISQDISKSINQLQLEATFTASDNLSPILALDDLTLGALLTAGEGQYISRNMDFSDAQFNKIRTSYEAAIPDGATVTPYYSIDAGKTWVPYTKATVTKKQIDKNYYRYTLEVLLHNQQTGDQALEKQFKGKIDLKSATPVLRPRVRRYTNTMIETDNSENSPVTTTTTTAGK